MTGRRLPGLNPDNHAFWTRGAEGELAICRCADCAVYIHPPLPVCMACGGPAAPAPVSGRGRVASFTVNRQAWLPTLAEPFVFAAVELEEQAELYVFSNIVNVPVDAVTIGMPVDVLFEQQEDVFIPLFQPRTAA